MGSTKVSDDENETMTENCANLKPLKSTKITPSSDVDSVMLHGRTKHRIPSPTREQGDGMEAEESKKLEAEATKTSEAKPPVKQKMITLPQTNIKLDKLPPITADQEVSLPIPDHSPLVKMTVSPLRADGVKRQSKEPKFVPYEPYKAAVKPIVPHKKKQVRSTSIASSSNSASTGVKTDAKVDAVSAPQPSYEDKLMSEMLQESNDRVKELETRLAESEKQIRIQNQVNAEVKKLLVASVGEDIEAKVDYLTQDKARLAADIRQYSNKIYKDFEEKEKLSVESDLWKSKFLACSVIVDELAHWKATLLQRNDDVGHHVRLLLHERSLLWDNMNRNLDVMNHLKAAFDPLSTQKEKEQQVCSVLGLAELSLKTANELKERLIGNDQRLQSVPLGLREKMDSPAEEGLRELISKKIESPSGGEDYSTVASVAVTGAARPHLAKMNDKLSSPNIHSSQFQCCTHCKGTVHTV